MESNKVARARSAPKYQIVFGDLNWAKEIARESNATAIWPIAAAKPFRFD